MPAVSKAQQRYMAIAEHNPSALRGPVPNMTHNQFHDFAATPRTGLPQHVKPPARVAPARVKMAAGGLAAAHASHPNASRLGKWLHPKRSK